MIPAMTTFHTNLPDVFDLPKRLAGFRELAYNLWWTWHPEAARLFGRLDMDLWERLHHNPIRLLNEIGRPRLNQAAKDKEYLAHFDEVLAAFHSYVDQATATRRSRRSSAQAWTSRTHPELNGKPIAYFSMEFGLHESLPIYSGGLGVLAGDHLKEASDLGLPLVGVGLMYAQGYFSQRIGEDGWQEALNNQLDFSILPALPVMDDSGSRMTIEVEFPDRLVTLGLWEIRVGRVPLYLLDSNLDPNSDSDKQMTARLYWSYLDRRVMQEVLLGVGGVRALRALGYNPSVWHMNEGHAAFLILERARELIAGGEAFERAIQKTRGQNVFTTHTPVPAGNDEFPLWLIEKYLAAFYPQLKLTNEQFFDLARHERSVGDSFSMGILALRNSEGRNAVSELHGKVSRKMWHFLWHDHAEADVPITHVTNGAHVSNWMARRLSNLFKEYLGEDWLDHLDEPDLWSSADTIPDAEFWLVRQHLKRRLVFYLRERVRDRWMHGGFHPVQVVSSGLMLNPYALTIGFARRFATYKRASLVLSDIERLLHIVNRPNMPVQIVFAGKAHPADEPGKQLIQQVYHQVKRAEAGGRIIFVEDYDMNLARYLVQGVDVWLNTPRRPLEASGTSGMKAAFNGALNFSVLDGWWREAYNGRNGWAIGRDKQIDSQEEQDAEDAQSLYRTLEHEIIPLFYQRDAKDIPQKWIAQVKDSMKTIIPQFSARRMLKEYVERLYVKALSSPLPRRKSRKAASRRKTAKEK